MLGFTVDVAALRTAAAQTSATDDALADALARLRVEAEDVLSRWRGNAATAFRGAWQQWDRAADEVLAELGRLAEELARSGVQYLLRDDVSAAELGAAS